MLTNAFFYCVYQKNVVPLHVKNIFRSRIMKHLLSILLIAMACIGCEPVGVQNKDIQGIGVFSVSETKKVTFSPGNLYYDRVTRTWDFFEEQYASLTINNLNSPCEHPRGDHWVSNLFFEALADSIDPEMQLGRKLDLFGWGTGDYPTLVSKDTADYATFYDWGFNKIGKDNSKDWRTLNYDEWDYLLHKRPNADSLWAFAAVYGCPGKIFLPDGWVCPDGVSYKPVHGNTPVMLEGVNNYYKDEWSIMEESGAVFLRYSCVRSGTILWLIESMAGYWVASYTDEADGVALGYFEDLTERSRCLGYSVRLVKDIK